MSKRLLIHVTVVLALAACGVSGEPQGRLVLDRALDPDPESGGPEGAIARFVGSAGGEVVLHGGAPVRWAALDPGGRFAATVGMDGRATRTRIEIREGVPAAVETVEAAAEVLEAPVFDPAGSGALILAVEVPGSGGNALVLVTASGGRRVLVGPGSHNERAAFSPDGTRVAFVSDRSGLPAVYVMRIGASIPVQITNRGIVLAPGKAAAGFVPPPSEGALEWTGAVVRYGSRAGRVTVDTATGAVAVEGQVVP